MAATAATLSFKQREKIVLLLCATVNTLTMAGAQTRSHTGCLDVGACTTPICVLCALDEATAYQAGPDHQALPPRHRPGPDAPARRHTEAQRRFAEYHEAGAHCRQLILDALHPDRDWSVDAIREILLGLANTITMGGNRLDHRSS